MRRTAAIPGWYITALALYGRLASTEWAVLMTVALRAWTAEGDREVATSVAQLVARVGREKAAVEHAIRALRTPPTEEYRWGAAPRHGRRGHGILQCTREGMARQPARYRLVLDWTKWGWAEGTNLAEVAKALKPVAVPASKGAQLAARRVRSWSLLHGGIDYVPPVVDVLDPQWLVWCEAMDRILERGLTVEDIEVALAEASHDDYWWRRLTFGPTHTLLEETITALVLRARRRAS